MGRTFLIASSNLASSSIWVSSESANAEDCVRYLVEVIDIVIETNKDKGRAGLSLAIAYFGSNGYTVSLPINDTQWYDLVVEKDDIFQSVQCKFTGSQDNTISLKSMGGTNGRVYDSILNHPVDLLFCADKDKNLYLIPMDELRKAGNQKTITLRTSPNSNNQGFNTFQYLVQI